MAKCFIIAQTRTDGAGLFEMLREIGAETWNSNAYDEGELLVEVCGRICYKAFGTGLNKNVTKVREGNREYIGNILKQRHGSVVEHASTTVAIIGCSRILTHELVRHRAGVAISQESQRFVRLDEFDVYIPDLDDPLEKLCRHSYPTFDDETVKRWVFNTSSQYMAAINKIKGVTQDKLLQLVNVLAMDVEGVPFEVKKQITSALRRFIPGGVNTNIICTANHRAWRHMISMRTSAGAEIEIREVFYDIARQFYDRYPAFYQDMGRDPTTLVCQFQHDKI